MPKKLAELLDRDRPSIMGVPDGWPPDEPPATVITRDGDVREPIAVDVNADVNFLDVLAELPMLETETVATWSPERGFHMVQRVKRPGDPPTPTPRVSADVFSHEFDRWRFGQPNRFNELVQMIQRGQLLGPEGGSATGVQAQLARESAGQDNNWRCNICGTTHPPDPCIPGAYL